MNHDVTPHGLTQSGTANYESHLILDADETVIAVPVTAVERSAYDDYTDDVPARVTYDRVVERDDRIIADTWLPDDSIVEQHLYWDEDNELQREATRIPDHDGLDDSVPVHWTRAGKAQRELQQIIEQGCTPAEALDFYMHDLYGMPQLTWAEIRGLSGHQSISQNVRNARMKIDSEATDSDDFENEVN